jgi:hypothetical protein
MARTRLVIVGLVFGVGLIASCSQSPPASAPTPRASVASTGSQAIKPCAPPTLAPAGAYSTALEAGTEGAMAATGYPYLTGTTPNCGPFLITATVFGNTDVSAGLDAALIQISVSGGSTTACNVYVYYASARWHYTTPVDCSGKVKYGPVPGMTDHVYVPGACANVRSGAGLSFKVVTCDADGSLVSIDTYFPRYVDGHIWLGVDTQGWMALDFLITPAS